MAWVMLTIAEGTFAILPRLAPVNRRQADKQCSRGQRCGQFLGRFLTQRAAPFETMIPTDIVIHARLQTRHGGHNRVTFRWMQVATGRITAECPASCFKLFPGGEAKGELE